MTSDKSYDNAQRITALQPRVGALEGDTSWTDTSSMANGWGKGGSGYFRYKLLKPGIVQVAANNLTTGTVTDGTSILTTALPTGYRPVTNKILVAYTDSTKSSPSGTNTETAAFKFVTDGSVQCLGFSTAATTASLYGLLFTDI